MIDQGATTIWERWDGWTAERGFQSAWMNSFNHYALGSVGEWLYRFVLGIDQDPARPVSAGWCCARTRAARCARPAAATGRCAGRSAADGSATAASSGSGSSCRRTSPPSVRVPSADPAPVRDGAGGQPAPSPDYPGLPGAREAVFQVGSGPHEFSGPAVQAP